MAAQKMVYAQPSSFVPDPVRQENGHKRFGNFLKDPTRKPNWLLNFISIIFLLLIAWLANIPNLLR